MEEFLQWAELLSPPFPPFSSCIQKEGVRSKPCCAGCSILFLPSAPQLWGMWNGEMLARYPNKEISKRQVWQCRQTQSLLLWHFPSCHPSDLLPESLRKRDRHRKSSFKLILHMEKDTKIHQTASFRAGLSLLTFSSCLLTHPKDQPLAKPKPNKKQAQVCSVIPLFFPFYPSWLCFHHPKCCPWAWGTCSGREKMNPLEMKLMWTGPSTGWILLCFTNGVSRTRGAKLQTQINTKSLSSWGNKTCTLGSLFSLSLLHRTQYFETLPFLFF